MKRRLLRIAIGSLVGLVAAFAIAWQMSRIDGPGEARSGAVTQQGRAAIGGPFTLVDHTGRTVTEADFADAYKLIYFGFTFCPDVCPTELQAIAGTMDRLGADAARVQPMLITIDPARDTPEKLAEYVPLFHPDLVGLTGTPEQIAAVARAYKVYYAKAPGDDPDTYLMDHSGFVYLMAPDGEFLQVFPAGTDPERISEAVGGHMKG
ncbi:MAG TPA: SCO family protein [Arenibaculum sp.]|nr:SCO family protein [Arenibaculum sp.]